MAQLESKWHLKEDALNLIAGVCQKSHFLSIVITAIKLYVHNLLWRVH